MSKAEEYARWIVANEDKKGTPDFDIVARAYQEAKAGGDPASVRAGKTLGDIPRQAGLTARYGVEGLAQLAQLGTEPIRLGMQALGAPKMQPLGEATSGLLDRIGLPQPRGADERVVGDATRLVAGGGGLAGGLSRAAQGAGGLAKTTMQALAANPGTQMAAGAGAGLAGGSVREADGGPLAQAGAALLGGVAAPLGMHAAAAGGRSALAAGRQALGSTQQLDGVLRFELGKAGGVNWDELGAAAKMQLRQDAQKAIYSGQPLDAAALRRLADFRAIGATPQLGDITQDPRILTQQRNLSKQMANMQGGVAGADLPNIDNANARRVLGTLDSAATSPLDEFGTGQAIIGRVQSRDAGMKSVENALYRQARESAGRDIPLARGEFVNAAFANLARENKTAFLPPEIGTMLNQISRGTIRQGGRDFDVPFNVDVIDNLKTVLATASRRADGNGRAAIKAVRDALENTQPAPIKRDFGGGQIVDAAGAQRLQQADELPEAAMAALDRARSTARERRTWQESAKFIEAALDDGQPDKFVKQFVIGGSVDDLARMKRELSNAPEALEGVKKQLVSYILERGRADRDVTKFSSAGMNDALRQLGDRKLSLFFAPEEIQQIKSAVNVGRYMQSQPIGSAVNNSNTAAMLTGRLSSLLDKASPIPMLGPLIAQPLQGGALRLQASQMNNLSRGLLGPTAPRPGVLGPASLYTGLLALPAVPPVQD